MIGNEPGKRHFCIIHGHFYQPPRENPWIDVVEIQSSSAPAHDWNERVYDECYRPNAYSRILDPDGMISGINNNYRNLSFNIGPTLFRWLEEKHPVIAQRIIDADEESARRMDGHGNAIAQIYNHIIMPLSSRRDQITQIRWANAFFTSRFGRAPEGMWLSETAINMETVCSLIDEGIRFVVLSPLQAEAFRPLEGDGKWVSTSKQPIDTRRPYRVFPYTKNGDRMNGSLDVFFFDERLSRAVSFEGLLNSAENFGGGIKACFDDSLGFEQAVIVATDGETFGHHKPFGDMCLSYFFDRTALDMGIEPVNFAYFLYRNPPVFEARLKNAFGEGSSWSCIHGTDRWIRDCGCQTGGRPSWNQKWRTPMRAALQLVQESVDNEYERVLKGIVNDPWKVRDGYMSVDCAAGTDTMKEFLEFNGAPKNISAEETHRAIRLLQAQKYILFSFTSCGWFFADISGIEAQQNMKYALRALQMALGRDGLLKTLKKFLDILETAESNLDKQTGKSIFERNIMPYLHHLERLCFTVLVHRGISDSKDLDFDLFGHEIRLRRLDNHKKRNEKTEFYLADIRKAGTGESGLFSVMFYRERGRKTFAYFIPGDVSEDNGFEIWRTECWSGHDMSVRLGSSDIFDESKLKLTEDIITHIVENESCQVWIDKNEAVLESLAEINGSVPENLKGPATYAFNRSWDGTISMLKEAGEEEDVYTSLLELWKRIERLGLKIDFSESIRLLDRLLRDEFGKMAEGISIASCDRIRCMLNIIDRFSVPVPKHQMEDAFYLLLTNRVQKLHEGYVQAGKSSKEDRSLLVYLLNFARRMNFSTERFPL